MNSYLVMWYFYTWGLILNYTEGFADRLSRTSGRMYLYLQANCFPSKVDVQNWVALWEDACHTFQLWHVQKRCSILEDTISPLRKRMHESHCPPHISKRTWCRLKKIHGHWKNMKQMMCWFLKEICCFSKIHQQFQLVSTVAVQAFKRNKIDTNWLDGLIRERAVRLKYEQLAPKNFNRVHTDSFPTECGYGLKCFTPKTVKYWKVPILLVHVYPMLIHT